MKDVLLLGSQSSSRHQLLKEAGIPFVTVPHRSSEEESVFTGDLAAYVIDIARHKMDSLVLPDVAQANKQHIFVLTADSLVQHLASGELLGKPADVADAKRMLGLARESEMLMMTGCCLREYVQEGDAWAAQQEKVWATPAYAEFIVPEDEVDFYLQQVPAAMHSAGAGILEGFGANYLKTLRGSFSGAMGLPIFEVRSTLKESGFTF